MSDTVKLKTERITRFSRHGRNEDLLGSLPVKPQDRYRFIRSIGFGGMKAVLLVNDADTGREIAMAIMPDFRERPHCDLERFVQEAKLTALLEHPNIVPVHDLGIDQSGSPYFTMKYLRGQSLAALLRKLRNGDQECIQKYTLVRMLQIFIRICNAIEFAHSRGICHLDLKPDNINIGEYGEVLVLDWGLARALDPNSETPSPGSICNDNGSERVKGTPGYMAPEQIHEMPELPINERSDIYALGCILYAMLTHKNPLNNFPLEEILRRTVTGEIPPPEENAAEGVTIPAALEAVAMKAMNLNPALRYHSVAELREELFAFQTGYATKAENASPLKHAGLFISRNMIILLLILSFLLSCALVTLAFYYRQALLN